MLIMAKRPLQVIDYSKETIGFKVTFPSSFIAAITKVLQKDGLANFVSYDAIDKAPEEKARGTFN